VTDAPLPVPEVSVIDASADANADVQALAFDDAFAELQRVVGVLESGGESLESTIAQYERAVALQRRCERLLSEAELRVQQLMRQSGGGQALVDVRPDEAGDATGDDA
jgi:exodeoxyribonuclease VII small subunit